MRQAVVRGAIVCLVACSLVVWASPALALQKCSDPVGDVTGDGTTDILDAQCGILVSLALLSGTSVPLCLNVPAENGDINCDAVPDVTDVVLVINLVLGIDLAEEIDANQNGCPEACEDIPLVLKRLAPVTTIGTATGSGFTIRGVGQSGSTAGKSTSGAASVGTEAVGTQP